MAKETTGHPAKMKEFENAIEKSLKREINLARNIQMKLLNSDPPDMPRGEVTGISIPARFVGGDYYDFCPLEDGSYRIIIGDVMGKGIPAAMLMILTRGAFRSLAQSAEGPGETLTMMNQALCEDLRQLKSFITLYCADWNPRTGHLRYANAGHHAPLLVREVSKEFLPLEASGIMIGGLPDQFYKEQHITLEPKDCLFFYTDGIIEAQNRSGKFFGKDRLLNLLKEVNTEDVFEIKHRVLNSIEMYTESLPQRDDITMVILKS
jgi:sigma-B regulation protein RsbU (phosphoserine phosphatase)